MASIQVTRRHCLKMMCGILFITTSHMVHHGQTDLLSGYVDMKFKIPESSRTDMEPSAAAVTFTRCLTHRLLKQSAARETDGQFGMNTPRGRQSLMRVKPTEATMLLRWTQTRYAIKLQMRPLLWRRGCAGGEVPAAIVRGRTLPCRSTNILTPQKKRSRIGWISPPWSCCSSEGASMDDVRTEGKKPMAQKMV